MFRRGRFINKPFTFAIIIVFLLSSNCATYRNMRSTGEYRIVKKEMVREIREFRIAKTPSFEHPTIEVIFGKYRVYREHRKVKEIGEKKSNRALVSSIIFTASGAALIAASGENVFSDSLESAEAAGGLALAFLGLLGFGIYFTTSKWKPAQRYTIREVELNDKSNFQPIPNVRVKTIASAISKEWTFRTNTQGLVILDISSILHLVETSSPLRLSFESVDTRKSLLDYTVPSDVISDLKHPLKLAFDKNSYFEGSLVNQLRTGQTYNLEIVPRNIGRVDGRNILVRLSAPNGVRFDKSTGTISKISANSIGDKLYFRFSLDRNYTYPDVILNIQFTQTDKVLVNESIRYTVQR